MGPLIDHEETGTVIKRTVVGEKNEYMTTLKVKMGATHNQMMSSPLGAMMSSGALTHLDTENSKDSKVRAQSEIRGSN